MHLSKKSYYILSAVVLFLVLIFILRIVSSKSAMRPSLRPLVVVGMVTNGDAVRTETLTGDILPIQQASIFSKVNGNIEKIFVDIGDRVNQNQLLALIDTTIYAQNAKQAKANFMQAEANFVNAKLNYERNKKLFLQKLIAQQDLDNATASFNVASAQREATEAAYNNALTQLNYCKVTAPFGGTITKRMLDPGAYVTASTGNQSSILFTLMNIDRLKTIVNVPERSVPYLNNVKDVVVTADALPNQKFYGKISKISQSIDLATRTMAVEISIDNSARTLKPGMFATVQFILEKKSNTHILPNQVILNDEKGDFVYLVNPDTTVSKKYVKIGIRMDSTFEVLSGLNGNDRVVVVGQNLVKDKMKVKIAK
ncbi:MAG: efflux RND transporter periplasmic adaptor subunit [Bacteroidota bacterium]